MISFNGDYLTKHLITYLGNKRSLLPFINGAIDDIKKELGNEHPIMFDGFSGSGCVARLFKHYAGELYVNDLEAYSETVNRCYLENKSKVDIKAVKDYIDDLNLPNPDLEIGFIRKNYAPKNDESIQNGERVFYTTRNAQFIDNARWFIESVIQKENPSLVPFALAPLLIKSSIHTNTSGIFKGFHKKNGIGHFGGAGENALKRIKKEIVLDCPIFCENEAPFFIFRDDTNKVVDLIPDVDIAYYDPPYNQHPYGSNYFMLNVINNYGSPVIQNGVSGIAKDWNKSMFNKKNQAKLAMSDLIQKTIAKYILVSYNNEGLIPVDEFNEMLSKHGRVSLKKQEYNTYKGGQKLLNGKCRSTKVEEMLWILKK